LRHQPACRLRGLAFNLYPQFSNITLGRDAMEKKENALEKITAKELREMALGLPRIQGVHVMEKEELITAIRAAKAITEPESKKGKKVLDKKEKVVLTVAQLKQKVKELRAKGKELLQQKQFEDG
jgi:hypothetical protein